MKQQLNELFGDEIKLTESTMVDVNTFANLFGDAKSLTYDNLMLIENERGYGYGECIQKWKDEGLIN